MSIREYEDGSLEARPDPPQREVRVRVWASVNDRPFLYSRSYLCDEGFEQTVLENLLVTGMTKVIDQAKGVST